MPCERRWKNYNKKAENAAGSKYRPYFDPAVILFCIFFDQPSLIDKLVFPFIPIWDNFVKGWFWVRLKEIRKKKGISQIKMAIDLNTNQNTISRYENGKREPSISDLIRIADYFDVSIDYLLGRTDNPYMQK